MTKNKGSTRVAMVLTPRRLLAMVCKYYGIGDAMELASSAKLGLSSAWRHSIYEEARSAACWILQRHCDLSLEELVQCDAVNGLEWSTIDLEVGVARVSRKLAEGDFALILGIESLERLLILELGTCPKGATINKKRTKKGL